MTSFDGRGVPIDVQGAAAAAAFDRAVEGLLGHRRDLAQRLADAVAADPGASLPHAFRGLCVSTLCDRRLRDAVIASRDAARDALRLRGERPREARFLASLEALIVGDYATAIAALDASLKADPRDAAALKLVHALRFLIGDAAGMRASLEAALPAWDETTPGYGYALGCLGFALEETGAYGPAEAAAREASARNAHDFWGMHAVAHVMEMTGRADEGGRWIADHDADWSICSNFRMHVFWHRALFLIEAGRAHDALELYDARIAPEITDDYRDLTNWASLLWRLQSEGLDVRGRWREAADFAAARLGDRSLVFADAHLMLALTGAGRLGDAAMAREAMARQAQTDDDAQAVTANAVGLALADAILACAQGDCPAALAALYPARDALPRIGGSWAQRDVFVQMLIRAAADAGEAALARELIAERDARRPNGSRWSAAASRALAA